MTTWLVTRHPGALDWLRAQGFTAVEHVPHLDPARVASGDTVIGTLPVHLASAVCERGARYFNLSLDVPETLRGRELSADELTAYGARLEEYAIRKLAQLPLKA
jgi:CRISPR-associated protein Csx16